MHTRQYRYIYTDSLILVSMDQAICLCYAAKKYILPDLVTKCAQYMLNNLSTVNVCRVLEFSKLIDDENLQVFIFLTFLFYLEFKN